MGTKLWGFYNQTLHYIKKTSLSWKRTAQNANTYIGSKKFPSLTH